MKLGRIAAVSLVVPVAIVLAAGCGATGTSTAGQSRPPGPTTASATAAAAKTYKLPKSMCAVADMSPIADLYPISDTPLVDTPGDCSVGRTSAAKIPLSVGVIGSLFPDASSADLFVSSGRRIRAGAVSISGVGSDAWYAVTGDTVTLSAVDGNLVIQVTVAPTRASDMPQRCGRIASGTFARLAPA
jgi:hypothetical protein